MANLIDSEWGWVATSLSENLIPCFLKPCHFVNWMKLRMSWNNILYQCYKPRACTIPNRWLCVGFNFKITLWKFQFIIAANDYQYILSNPPPHPNTHLSVGIGWLGRCAGRGFCRHRWKPGQSKSHNNNNLQWLCFKLLPPILTQSDRDSPGQDRLIRKVG